MDWKFLQGGQDDRLSGTLSFLVRLLVLSVPLYAAALFADMLPLQVAVAGHSQLLLEGLGFAVAREGALMEANGFSFFISPDSTGWKSMLFLGALVAAVPGVVWKRRLLGIGLGVPLVYLGNLGRVATIVLTEQAYGYEAAMFAHDVLWRFGLIGMVLAVWGVWFLKSREGKHAD